MWLARLFTGSSDDSEPSEFPPHPAATCVATQIPARSASSTASASMTSAHNPAVKGSGFDPYNSGAFRKSSAWERIGRR